MNPPIIAARALNTKINAGRPRYLSSDALSSAADALEEDDLAKAISARESAEHVADAGLPADLTDERLKTFLLNEWEPPKPQTAVRRVLYKLQRHLQVSDLWPLEATTGTTGVSSARLEEKVKLLTAVRRLVATTDILAPTHIRPPQTTEEDNPFVDRMALRRHDQLRRLAKLTVEEIQENPPTPVVTPKRRNQQRMMAKPQYPEWNPGTNRGEDMPETEQFPSRYGLSREQRMEFFKRQEMERRWEEEGRPHWGRPREKPMRVRPSDQERPLRQLVEDELRGGSRHALSPRGPEGGSGRSAGLPSTPREERERYWRERDAGARQGK